MPDFLGQHLSSVSYIHNTVTSNPDAAPSLDMGCRTSQLRGVARPQEAGGSKICARKIILPH